MAIMYIREYSRLAKDSNGDTIQAGQEPAIASQFITYTATAELSAVFNARTKFIRIFIDADGFIDVGDSPVAVTLQSMPLSARAPEFFGVTQNHRVSAVE